MGATQRENMDPAPYEVEFMNVVVDKANDLQVTDADSHFAQFADVHPSKIKQGKLFLYDKLKPADRERVMQNICKKGARFTYMTMDLLDKKGAPLFVHCVGQNYEDSTLCRMTFADVSESRRRQEQLRAQAVEMNELIDLVCGGVCLFKVTPEMHIECLYLNKGCCRLFGTSQESSRLRAYRLDELLHPVFDKAALKQAKVLTRGLPASPGAACGQIVFFADDAAEWHAAGKRVVMVRIETSPEDLAGMAVAEGILTARGGMTSHAAVVARGMGKCCVSGAGALNIDYKARTVEVDGVVLKEGDFISLNGSTGEVYKGKVETKAAELSGDFAELMQLADKYTKLQVRTNADTPHDAQVARNFGAVGIGLCRTEHMFFEGEKIKAMREMILAENAEGRRKALSKILPYQQADFKGIFKAMEGCPVTVRLLDPPLHEFVPHDLKGQQEMADTMGVSLQYIQQRVEALCEHNPMLGHRGCRLGNTYPEITQMQTRAILGAALELKKEGVETHPEIMVPLTGILYEFKQQEEVIRAEAAKLFAEAGDSIEFKVGTMIEIPRAALTADRIASSAEFFSFGTNDLTQMTFGYSRDDIASFLPIYLEKKILKVDPFQVLDQNGVGQLVRMATEKGRAIRPDLKCGICGEHGGEPSSVKFCHKVGLNYVSCSPFRVPIARLAAAQAAIEE